MSIAFRTFFERLCKATDIASQMDLARALGVNRSAITQAKVRDAVPQKWILALTRRYGLSPDWLEFGTGTPRSGLIHAPQRNAATPLTCSGSPVAGLRAGQAVAAAAQNRAGKRLLAMPPLDAAGDTVLIPKAAARLCAGGGSFEVAAEPAAEYPFPRSWLAGLGNPSGMVFMDVVGDSMEPGICDGDMVLVDQSNIRLDPAAVLAVGFEDAIYLKRVERRAGGLVLFSDNPAYAVMELYGDELENFRIIGKMVWLCREYR